MEFYKLLIENLETHTKNNTPNHSFKDVYFYSLIPAGKLFRPLLAVNICSDLSSTDNTLSLLKNTRSTLSNNCSALEVHHTYTLIHDDMPCMDNDDFRRGRESTHKKFGEWKALLAADGLLNLSYQLFAKAQHPHQIDLIKIASWALGPKGLIQGQALDLDIANNKTFEDILLIHKLKTARLIQLSLICGAHASSLERLSINTIKTLLRLGEALGLTFQLVDDLIDLYEDDQDHEKEINPWIHHFDITNVTTLKYIKQTQEILKMNDLDNTYNFVNRYIKNSYDKFIKLVPKSEIKKYDDLIKIVSSIN